MSGADDRPTSDRSPSASAPALPAGTRPVRTGVLPEPAPDVRLTPPEPGAGRPINLWRPSVLTMSALATIALVTWAPHVLPELWASLRNHLVAAATAIRSGDSAGGRAEAARALLLLTPVLGMALLGVVFAIWAGRPPKVTSLTDNWAPAPEASAAEKATPRRGTAEVAAPAAGRSTINIGGLTSFLTGAVPVLVLGALAVAGLDERVATVGEGRLAAGALYPAPAPGGLSWPDTLVVPQIAAIDILLRSAPGPGDVVDRARAALLVAGVLGCLLLWTAARRILPAPSAALAMALCGLPALALGLYGTVDAGVLGALWLTAAAALAGRSRGATLLAVGATVIAGLTVPLAAVAPLVMVGHGLLDGSFGVGLSRAESLAVGLIGAAGVIALGVTSRWPPDGVAWVVGSGHGAVPGPVLAGVFAAGVVVTALAWRLTPSLRPLSTAAGAVLACAAVPGPHVTTALLLALPVLAALAAAVIDERPRRRWRKPGS